MSTSSTAAAPAASSIARTAPAEIAPLPYQCQPWCTDGEGHPDALHPDDRYCISRDWHVALSLGDPVLMGNGSGIGDIWVRDHLQLSLQRDAARDDDDRVVIEHKSVPRGITLTRDEFRRFIGAGLALLDASEPQKA